MIALFACAPLRASISERQCGVNRDSGLYACKGCDGLGDLVSLHPAYDVPPPPRAHASRAKPGRKKSALREAIDKDRALGGAMTLESLEEHEPRLISVEFDLADDDDREMIRRAEQVAFEHGITLGDELLCRLRVLDGAL